MAPPVSVNPAHVALFAHVACRPEPELDLGQAALMLAEPEYPALDIAAYLRALDGLATRAQGALGAAGGAGGPSR